MADTVAYVGLGGNLFRPKIQIEVAVGHLRRLMAVNVLQCSSIYQSRPLAGLDQPDYCNAVVELSTRLSAKGLLAELQLIEEKMGRPKEHVRWGSRVIDLDLLLYGMQVSHSHELTIPHLGLTEREFVIYPLAELVPELTLPGGESISELKKQCRRRGLCKVGEIFFKEG